jgi:hypothetical protein
MGYFVEYPPTPDTIKSPQNPQNGTLWDMGVKSRSPACVAKKGFQSDLEGFWVKMRFYTGFSSVFAGFWGIRTIYGDLRCLESKNDVYPY